LAHRRQANANVNQHAVDALQKVIDRITNGDTGLNRASDAVTYRRLLTRSPDHEQLPWTALTG
jgi:hypothetical protein